MDIINDLRNAINQHEMEIEHLKRQLEEEVNKYKVVHKAQAERDWFKKHGLIYDLYKIKDVEVNTDGRGRGMVTTVIIDGWLDCGPIKNVPFHIEVVGVKRFKYFLSGEKVERFPDELQPLVDAVMKDYYEAQEIFTPIEYYEFE